MHHPVMRSAEAEDLQLMVRVADKIAVGEEQQLNDIPAQIDLPKAKGPRLRAPRIGGRHGTRKIYVSHIDVSWFQCYKTINRDEILDRFVRGGVSRLFETAQQGREPRIDLPCDCRAACRQTYWTSAFRKSMSCRAGVPKRKGWRGAGFRE